ncbi:MAG TPA: phage major capsid protein, partial [Acidimicrobiales bacterium]|nr:phage major capsid protein [Acidimicrobiales bacterium]
ARLGSGLGDAVSAAINAIETNYFGEPSAIVSHPRNVDKLRRVKDSSGRYIFEPGYNMQATPQMGGTPTFMGGDAQSPVAVGTIWGLPVISDANVPTNYSGTTPGTGAESPIIVGDFAEAYVFDRMGFTIDVSNEAGTAFEQNQTWFRGEERLGFTAARQPTAFCWITALPSTISG